MIFTCDPLIALTLLPLLESDTPQRVVQLLVRDFGHESSTRHRSQWGESDPRMSCFTVQPEQSACRDGPLADGRELPLCLETIDLIDRFSLRFATLAHINPLPHHPGAISV